MFGMTFRRRLWVAGAAWVILFLLVEMAPVRAGVRENIEAALRTATTAFVDGDWDGAARALQKATVVAQDAGLSQDRLMALVHLLSGAVQAEGRGAAGQAVQLFRRALRIDPAVKLTKAIARDKVVAAFKSAYIMHKTEVAADRQTPAPAVPSSAEAEPARTAVAPVPAPAVPEAQELEESDLPAEIPQPLYCPNPDEAPPNLRALLRCVTQRRLKVARVMLHYRLPGQEEFESTPAHKTPQGWFVAVVPAEAFSGTFVQYYFEARNALDKPVAFNGRWDSPNLMMIRQGAPAVEMDTLAGVRMRGAELVLHDDDNPLTRRNQIEDAGVDRAGRFWVALALGKGFGRHGDTTLEWYVDQANDPRSVAGGLRSSGLVVITPEFGYRFTRQWAAAVHSRHQLISRTGAEDTLEGAPATGAHAVFVRGIYFWQPLAPLEIGFSASLGVGDGVRLIVPPDETANPARGSSDSVRVGSWLMGPGVSLDYWVNHAFAVRGAVQTFIGVPASGFVMDFHLGVAYGF